VAPPTPVATELAVDVLVPPAVEPSVVGTTSAPPDTIAPKLIPDALKFSAPLIGGGEIDLATLAGPPVVLWFWAPFCVICNREAKGIQEAALRWKDTANFVGVAWTGSDDQFENFIERYGLTFPQISDDLGEIYAKFEIPVQPAMGIVLPTGEVQILFGAASGSLIDTLIGAAVA
jgi:peroxiredoxin